MKLKVYEKSLQGMYVYKNNMYVFNKVVQVKDRKNGKWYEAIEYFGKKTGEFYVREKEDFFIKFERLPDQ